MASMLPQPSGAVVRVKPQPDIYTLLVILAVLVMAVAVGFVAHNLMVNYGLTFQQLFSGQPAV
jgi:hypothetical protein